MGLWYYDTGNEKGAITIIVYTPVMIIAYLKLLLFKMTGVFVKFYNFSANKLKIVNIFY